MVCVADSSLSPWGPGDGAWGAVSAQKAGQRTAKGVLGGNKAWGIVTGLDRALGKVAGVMPCGMGGPHPHPAHGVWHLGHMLDLDPGHQVLWLSLKVLRSERFLWVIVFLFFS